MARDLVWSRVRAAGVPFASLGFSSIWPQKMGLKATEVREVTEILRLTSDFA